MSGSCERESLTNAIDSPFKGKDIDRIVKAQEWLLKNAPITKSDEQWNPMWEDAFTDDFSSIQTVEIPLELKKFSIPIHPECKAKYNETKDPKYLNAITRLIIKTDSKTGRTDGFFMYIIPSLKYLEKTNFRPLNNSYLSKDEKYDGYIIFRDLSGNYVNGWMYEDGQIKKVFKACYK